MMKQILIKKTESKNIVEGAEENATRMHAGQKRQYIAAAWLHDVVEDTSATIGNIKNNFGGAMANIVAILTKGSNEEEYAKRFAKCKKEIALIKLADFYDNTSMLIHLDKKHKEQYTYFAEKFYLPLARKLNKSLYEKIKNNIDGVRPKT